MFGLRARRVMAKWMGGAIVALALNGIALAQTASAEETVVKNALEVRFPKAKIANLRKAVVLQA